MFNLKAEQYPLDLLGFCKYNRGRHYFCVLLLKCNRTINSPSDIKNIQLDKIYT